MRGSDGRRLVAWLRQALCGVWLLLVCHSPVWAVNLDDPSRSVRVTSEAQVLEDPTGAMTLRQALTSQDWRTPRWSAFNFGLSRSVWWVRVLLRNSTDRMQPYVLNLGTTQQDWVEWHVFDGSSGQRLSTGQIGDFLDFRDRPIQTRRLAVPLPMAAQAEQMVYLRLESRGPAFSIMHLSVSVERVFLTSERWRDALAGLFYGVAVTSAVLGVMLFVAIAWPPAGWFAVFVIAFGLYAAFFWGSDMQLLSLHSPLMRQHGMVSAGVFAYISGNAAAMSLVQLHRHVSRRSMVVMHSLTASALLPLLVAFYNDMQTSEWLSFVCGLALLGWGCFVLGSLARKRVAYALPLFLMYMIMVMALLAYSVHVFGVVQAASPYVVDVIQIGVVAVLLLLGLALAVEVRGQVQAQSFKQARLAMVRYVAHDIRAPQSAILALLGRAERGEVPNELKSAIEDQVSRTVALTEAFLWLSKAESSVYRFEAVYAGDVVHEAIDVAWPLLEKKRIKVEREGLDSEGAQIRADREMLVRCIFNLLENAAKYSEAGTTVKVSLGVEGEQVKLSIRDQGVGMSPEFVRQAFADYRRSKNSFGESGFGLGLAFVATVLEQHGAAITCHSQPGHGSTFVLSFELSSRLLD